MVVRKCQNKLKPKGGCNEPTKLQFRIILIRAVLKLSKRYESTEVDRRTWLYVPSGTHWSTNSDTHLVVEISSLYLKGRQRKNAVNLFLTYGNISSKVKSNVTTVKLDMYYINIKQYTKFQINITKDVWKSSEKQVDRRRVDGQANRRTGWLATNNVIGIL